MWGGLEAILLLLPRQSRDLSAVSGQHRNGVLPCRPPLICRASAARRQPLLRCEVAGRAPGSRSLGNCEPVWSPSTVSAATGPSSEDHGTLKTRCRERKPDCFLLRSFVLLRSILNFRLLSLETTATWQTFPSRATQAHMGAGGSPFGRSLRFFVEKIR